MKLSHRHRATLRPAGIILLIVAVVVIGLRFAYKQTFGTTDQGDYGSVLKEWSSTSPSFVSHFPTAIPPDAMNVRFSAAPKLLQGGAHIQLRMRLRAEEVRAIETQLKSANTHVYVGGDVYTHYNADQKHNRPTTRFRTADTEQGQLSFPDHYALYSLSAKDRGMGSWNHGDTSGVAVSTKLNEVVYWADSW